MPHFNSNRLVGHRAWSGLGFALLVLTGSTAARAASVTITVNPSISHPISPFVYGINSWAGLETLPKALTLDRAGGNRWTAYNWITNASNAGSDYQYQNDGLLDTGKSPAFPIIDFIGKDQPRGMSTVMTVQMQGLVAGDEKGPVNMSSPPDKTRFKTLIFQKKSLSKQPFTASPSASDEEVFADEYVWAVDKKFAGKNIFGPASTSPRVFVQLDNEPELWDTTHREIQGATRVTTDAYIAKTIALATALKTQFPDMVIMGPGNYGFFGIYAWNGEFTATPNGNDWFPDKYLPAIKKASASFGHPLVDVYDFHWYPEATDGNKNRVTTLNGPTLNDAQVQAVVQSPRSLWDPTYKEDSWVTQTLGQPINILGRLQAKIAAENPDMKLSLTEYFNGGGEHIAGALAQADNLGIFGAQGLFAATLWPMVQKEPYVFAGFRAFRDFDGANHHFGDTSVRAVSSDVGSVSAYVSTDSERPGRVVVVAINRSTSEQSTTINGQPLTGTAHLYRMTAASTKGQSLIKPVQAGTAAVSGSAMTLSLPALSVTTIDIY